jgi:hypothetical protein
MAAKPSAISPCDVKKNLLESVLAANLWERGNERR